MARNQAQYSDIKNTMPFFWQGFNREKKICQGKINAIDQQHVRQLLLQKGITTYNIRALNLWHRLKLKRKNSIKSVEITNLLLQLANLFSAGIDLIAALSLLAKQQSNKSLVSLLLNLIDDLKSGLSLSQSLQQYPAYFDTLSCRLIVAGEQAGTLEKMISCAARQRINRQQIKSDIISTCLYPAVVLMMAIIISIVFLIVIIPKFADLFAESNVSLPRLTKIVISFSDLIKHYGGYLVLIIASLILIFTISKKYSYRLALYSDFLLLKLPLFGNLIQKSILVRCLQTLCMSITAGIPLTQSLPLCMQVANNLVFNWAFCQLRSKTASGKSLALSMQETNAFPTLIVEMTASGENSGKLSIMLTQASELYQADIRDFSKRLQKLLEPIIMLVLGTMIGILLLAMYLPIFKLGMTI